MNHQELSILGASLPSYFKPLQQFLLDVNSPKLFSGWPYFIILLATLVAGSMKLSSLYAQAEHSSSARLTRMVSYSEGEMPKRF